MWSVYRVVVDGVYGDDLDDISELDQAVNQSILRKLAQPHKPKINPNLEIWINLDNLETILRILCLSISEHSADISVEPPCVTYENCQGKNCSKTDQENPGSLPNSYNLSVSAMPWCNGLI